MIVQDLQNFVSYLERRVIKDKTYAEMFVKLTTELSPVTSVVSKLNYFVDIVYFIFIRNAVTSQANWRAWMYTGVW